MTRLSAIGWVWVLASGPVVAAESVLDTAIMTRSILSLFVVLGTVVVLAWLARRIKGLNPASSDSEGALRIVAQQSLGIKDKLVLVEVGERRILLGVSPGNIRFLTEADPGVQKSSHSSAWDS